jgi:hypothetical protein
MTKKLLLITALPLLLSACNEISGPPDLQSLHEARPVSDAKELDVDVKYDIGELEISKASDDNLFSLDLQYDRRRSEPRFSFNDGERSSMRLDMDSHGAGFGSRSSHENDLNLRLTDKVPIDLELTTGVSESRLEMGGLRLRRLKIRGGVGKTEVTFDKASGEVMSALDVESGVGELIIHGLGNAQVQRVDLKGGVGHTELDFTGEAAEVPTDARIKVGVGAVKLIVPRDADVEIQAEGSFLSNISAPSFERDGHNYTHRGDGGPKLRIRVESGVGGVEVELI